MKYCERCRLCGGCKFPIGRGHPSVCQECFILRDSFASAALAGMLAADGNDPRWTGHDTGKDCQRGGGKWIDPDGVARQAYEIAEAMIRIRTQSNLDDVTEEAAKDGD